MTKEKVSDFLAMVQTAFPNYTPANKGAAITVWSMALEEYTDDQVAMALKAYIRTDTSGFAPAPGQLIELIHYMSDPQYLNEREAWQLVYAAICNSGYNSVEEFAKLPPLVQKAVGCPYQLKVWASDEGFNNGAEYSNFAKVYREEVSKARQYNKMPEDIKHKIDMTAASTSA